MNNSSQCDTMQTIDNLNKEIKKLNDKNDELKREISVLSQSQKTAIGSGVGVLIVTIMSGLGVFFAEIDKSKSAILIVALLCWTSLTAMCLLLLSRAREEDGRH